MLKILLKRIRNKKRIYLLRTNTNYMYFKKGNLKTKLVEITELEFNQQQQQENTVEEHS